MPLRLSHYARAHPSHATLLPPLSPLDIARQRALRRGFQPAAIQAASLRLRHMMPRLAMLIRQIDIATAAARHGALRYRQALLPYVT